MSFNITQLYSGIQSEAVIIWLNLNIDKIINAIKKEKNGVRIQKESSVWMIYDSECFRELNRSRMQESTQRLFGDVPQ